MTELEQAEHYIEVLYIFANIGFALWGIAGWYAGRTLQMKEYIKPTELVNIKLMRQIENDNYDKNSEINTLKGQIAHYDAENDLLSKANKELELQNRSLWYWNYAPHRDAEFITIRQQDKNGEDVATSQIMLPDSKEWAYEPVAYADERAEDFYKWKDELPHQSNAAHL